MAEINSASQISPFALIGGPTVERLAHEAEHVAMGGLPVSDGLQFNAKTTNPVRGSFGIDIPNPTSYLGVPDDMMSVGYNTRSSTLVTSEPSFAIHFESDYRITGVRGSATSIRTIETYWTFDPEQDTGSGVETRNYFSSYVPDFENGGANPYLNYGYMMTGSNYLGATGGAGLQIYSGSDPTFVTGTGAILGGFDYDGLKMSYGITCAPVSFDTYTSGTGGGTTSQSITVTSGPVYWIGQYLQFYTVNATGNKGYTAVGTPRRVKSVVGNVVNLYDVSSQALAATGAISIGIASPANIATAKLGVGMAISNVGGLALEVGGAGVIHGGFSVVEAGVNGAAQVAAFSDGQIAGIRGGTGYQFMNFYQTGAFQWAWGALKNSPNNSFGIGPWQSTDSNFTQAISWASFSPNGLGLGGTSASNSNANSAPLRIYNGTNPQAAGNYGHICLEAFSAYTGNAGTACVITWNGTNLVGRVGTTDHIIF